MEPKLALFLTSLKKNKTNKQKKNKIVDQREAYLHANILEGG